MEVGGIGGLGGAAASPTTRGVGADDASNDSDDAGGMLEGLLRGSDVKLPLFRWASGAAIALEMARHFLAVAGLTDGLRREQVGSTASARASEERVHV